MSVLEWVGVVAAGWVLLAAALTAGWFGLVLAGVFVARRRHRRRGGFVAQGRPRIGA